VSVRLILMAASAVAVLQVLFWSPVVSAQAVSGVSAQPLVSFETTAQQTLYVELTQELRCLKCQNQSIADSPAGVAVDLRREIREQVLAGKNAVDVKEYMIQRYGEFILYRPRFTAKTLLLWLGPALILLLGLWLAVRFTRERQQPRASTVLNDNDLEKARSLLRK